MQPERRLTLDDLLRRARSAIERVSVFEAFAAAAEGALIVDIRSDVDRDYAGVVPESVHIPRTVLEWRLAPESPWRNPYVGGIDRQVILMCEATPLLARASPPPCSSSSATRTPATSSAASRRGS